MADDRAMPTLVFEDPPAPRRPPIGAGIEGDLPGGIMDILAGVAQESRSEIRALLKALIAEGRRYGETPAGRRWAEILADSALVRNGWLIWNQANIDLYLRNAPTLADDPGAMLEDVLRRLAAADLAALVSRLQAMSLAADLAAAAGEPR